MIANSSSTRITNRRGKSIDITRYGRFSEQIDFLHYTAFGRVWYGAKYSHRVWEQFAHTFLKYFLLNSRSVNYYFRPYFRFFPESGNPRSVNKFCSGLFSTFSEFMRGFAIIPRIINRIWCHSPNYWRDLLSFTKFLIGFGIILDRLF